MLTSKQRAALSGLANDLNPVVFLGKAGAADGVYEALDKALTDHELVKLRFVDFKGERKELARALAEKAGADLVRVIGHVAIMYRQSPDPEKRSIKLD
ncbi:MAG: ribosome assembly RNA-binding protein YhbY [Spirochaetae bacterium HGW-Spirochaetae-3]|jgi:RNA-binding protein|nr:MAG: ribosome assembly RNA-binding protein YhbY [Spirochaetae bacterium HGW-Spirochaetae-3]